MGSWAPITPRKPMRGGSSVVVDGGGGQDRNYYTGEREEDPLGRSNVASNSQGGCSNVFELDDLLDTDQMPMSFTSLLSGGDHLFQVPQCEWDRICFFSVFVAILAVFSVEHCLDPVAELGK